jgi:hypothetical protein
VKYDPHFSPGLDTKKARMPFDLLDLKGLRAISEPLQCGKNVFLAIFRKLFKLALRSGRENYIGGGQHVPSLVGS